jgi:DNA invertase Pin-like site-specific DNA recombinase
LVIAKLDRLSRNLAFIAMLMDRKVDFVCCDNPTATKFTIHILAAVAEHERDAISARTKAALAVAKANGKKLGNYQRIAEAKQRARRSRAIRDRRDRAPPRTLLPMRLTGAASGPASGRQWHAMQVHRFRARLGLRSVDHRGACFGGRELFSARPGYWFTSAT